MKTTSATTKSSTYSKSVLSRVYDKQGKLLGYSAEPETLYEYGNLGLPKVNYQVTCNEQTGEWACTCPATKPCKHMRAAMLLNEIRLGVATPVAEEEVAPVVEEKKVRKPRSYTFDVPADTLAMRALIGELHRTTSKAKAEAICKVFASMIDAEGKIHIHHMTWYYDADLKNIFELLEVPNDASEVSPFVDPVLSNVPQELPELPEVTEEVLDDEIKEEWSEPDFASMTKAQIIMQVRECAFDLVRVCDGAEAKDGAGCNGVDAKFLHDVIRYDTWTQKQILKVAEKLQKYNKTQLRGCVPAMAIVRKAFGISTEKQRNEAPLNGNQGFSILRRHA